MFYKIDLSFLTYETLSAESITIIESHKWDIEQLEQYGNLLKEIGFNDITIFLNVFVIENDGEFPQCNFEIFNSTLL